MSFLNSDLCHFLVWRVLPRLFNWLCLCRSGTLWMTWSLGGSTWYWNGFLQCRIQSDLTRSVHTYSFITRCVFKHSLNMHYWHVNKAAFYIMLSSHIPTRRAHYSDCKIIISINWLCFMLQVLQLQSLQSYQNKTVPSAALLFVHMERAHSLPVSHLQFIYTLCSR